MNSLGLMEEGIKVNKGFHYSSGCFFNDKKDGYGEYYWIDGRVYKGQWREGK